MTGAKNEYMSRLHTLPLIYDNIPSLERFVSACIARDDRRKALLSKLTAVEECFKFAYTSHIGKYGDISHSMQKSLLLPGSSGVICLVTIGFDTCLLPYQVLENILESICSELVHYSFIYSTGRRLRLYIFHLHRAIAQERWIADKFQTMKGLRARTSAIVIMDYKMKLESIRYWESWLEFYGKRGIICHGSVVLYRRKQYNDAVGDDLGGFFIDYISGNDNAQDSLAVLSIFDVIMARINLELPTVTSFTVITDNARNYQNDFIPVAVPFICHAYVVTMEARIDPESSRGKGLVDSHFPVTMNHGYRYFQVTGHDVCTPRELWTLLQSRA